MKTKSNEELVLKIAKMISLQITTADWFATFWDEIDELKDKDVLRERKKLLKLSGEIVKVVHDNMLSRVQ